MKNSLPSGTVTFLFTDMQGSTPLWEQMPAEMRVSVAQHHAILRDSIEGCGGQIFEIIGDAFSAAFRHAADGLAAAIAIQRALRSASWGKTGPLKVRMGLHTGEVELDPQDIAPYAGSRTLNRVARIMSAAHGGQILLSQEAANLVERDLPEGVTLLDLGEHQMKGLQRKEHLYQVCVPGLEQHFPLPVTIADRRDNLPMQMTSYVGREKEGVEVIRFLQQTRLLTLSGVGGTGKTRLALHCAEEVIAEFKDGVWLVELARLTDPRRILPGVAAVFGYYEGQQDAAPDGGGSSAMGLEARLLHYLRDKHLLILLDNCEHLIGAAAGLVETILRAAPQVKIIATSREALGLPGELIYLVPALSLPQENHPTVEAMLQSDAVRLFAERAKAALPAFALTEANAPEVAQICQRLDGIPLAIELASSRVKALSTAQIRARLDDRFRLLTGGSRTALPRQQTLRATIDWSYGLLTFPEQALLRGLSVFVGGWTLEAAEAVCACDGALDVLDGLALLVNKSLVEAQVEGGEVRRYRLLETVRQYAQEKLDDAGEAAGARDRHLAYFLGVSRQVEQAMKFLRGWEAAQPLRVELANFRAAISWAYGMPDFTAVAAGLELASNLLIYWQTLNILQEGRLWTKQGLAQLAESWDAFLPLLAKAYACAADLSNLLDHNYDCFNLAWQSIQLFRRCSGGDEYYLVVALMYHGPRGVYVIEAGKPAEELDAAARQIRKEGTALAERLGLPGARVQAADYNAWAAIELDDYEELSRQAEAMAMLTQGTSYEGWEHFYLGYLANEQGDFTGALWHYHICLDLARKRDMKIMFGYIQRSLGNCYLKMQQTDRAWECYSEVLAPARELGQKWMYTSILRKLAEISLLRGEYRQACQYLDQDLELAPEIDGDNLAFECLLPLLGAADGTAAPEKLARLLGYFHQLVQNVYGDWGVHQAVYDRVVAGCRSRLEPGVYQACLEAGGKMSIEQMQAEARLMLREMVERAGSQPATSGKDQASA